MKKTWVDDVRFFGGKIVAGSTSIGGVSFQHRSEWDSHRNCDKFVSSIASHAMKSTRVSLPEGKVVLYFSVFVNLK